MYTGPHSSGGGRTTTWLRWSLWIGALAAVSAQAGWWWAPAGYRDRLLAIAAVLSFAAAMGHSLVVRRAAWTFGFVVITAGLWLLAGWSNQHLELPLGHLSYGHRIGPLLIGSPVWLLLAWVSSAYLALIGARRVTNPTLVVSVLAGCFMAATTIAEQAGLHRFGYTTWSHPHPGIPGLPGIPAQAFVGLLLVGVVTMLLVDMLPAASGADGPVRLMFAGTYLISLIASEIVLDASTLAVTVTVVGGLLAVPLAYLTFVDRV